MSSQEYAQNVLKVAIAKICQAIGWDSTHVSAMDMLTDVTHHFLREISRVMHAYCELNNRTEPNLDDLVLAYKHVGIDLNALKEYIEFVDPIPMPLKVPKFPLPTETNLNFPMTGSQELVKRPAHIPEYMPPMPVVEKENAKALPTTIDTSFSNLRESVEESKETASCAENIVVTSNAVESGDEMCVEIQTIEAKEPVIGETSLVEFETASQDDEIQQRRVHCSLVNTTSSFTAMVQRGKLPVSRIPIIPEETPIRPVSSARTISTLALAQPIVHADSNAIPHRPQQETNGTFNSKDFLHDIRSTSDTVGSFVISVSPGSCSPKDDVIGSENVPIEPIPSGGILFPTKHTLNESVIFTELSQKTVEPQRMKVPRRPERVTAPDLLESFPTKPKSSSKMPVVSSSPLNDNSGPDPIKVGVQPNEASLLESCVKWSMFVANSGANLERHTSQTSSPHVMHVSGRETIVSSASTTSTPTAPWRDDSYTRTKWLVENIPQTGVITLGAYKKKSKRSRKNEKQTAKRAKNDAATPVLLEEVQQLPLQPLPEAMKNPDTSVPAVMSPLSINPACFGPAHVNHPEPFGLCLMSVSHSQNNPISSTQSVQIEQVAQESVSVANADDEATLTKVPELNPSLFKEDYAMILPAAKGLLPVTNSSHFDQSDDCTTVASTSGMSKKMNNKNKENKKNTNKLTTGATYSSSMLTNRLFSVEELRRKRNKDKKKKKHKKRDQLFVSPEPTTVPVVPKLVLNISRTKVTESPSSEMELLQTLQEMKPINHQPQWVVRSADTFDAEPTHASNVDGNLLSICPACGRVEDDRPMIACDECGEWYDWECVGILVSPEAEEDWYCPACVAKK